MLAAGAGAGVLGMAAPANASADGRVRTGLEHLVRDRFRTGSDRVRKAIDAGTSVDAIVASWRPELADFTRLRRRFLRYD